MRFYRQFRVAPGKTMHRFFRVVRVFRGLFFVGLQMENGKSASGLIDKSDPQSNADQRRSAQISADFPIQVCGEKPTLFPDCDPGGSLLQRCCCENR
jgi:hypothetical protein